MQRPLVIEVTDETGARVDKALVSFLLPEDGISGTFRNGLKTEILTTGEGGQASMRSLLAGGFSGQFQVRVMVAKGEARAGTLSIQYIAPDTRKHQVHSILAAHPHVWEVAGLVVVGLGAEYLKSRTSSGAGGSGASAAVPPVFGVPTAVVGKP